MKTKNHIIVFTFFLLLQYLSHSQTITPFPSPKGYIFIPGGSFQSNNEKHEIKPFYMSQAEITNKQYNEFLNDLKVKNNVIDYNKAKIENTLWDSIDFSEKYSSKYHTYEDYPVVNISKEAAQLYCSWLTEKLRNEGKIPDGLKFRLPKEEEWIWAAKGNLDSPKYPCGNFTKDKKGNFLVRYKTLKSIWGPAEIKSFKPNNYGLYDMAGNVSEMISDRKIVKGGDWNSSIDHLLINNYQEYYTSPTIGFRPVISYFKEN